MKKNSHRNIPASSLIKVMPLAACAFFLCLTSVDAQNNTASGADASLVYGSTTPNQITVATLTDGTADLDVYNPITTTITLNKDIVGYINISNNFSSFNLIATDGNLFATNGTSLSISGGSNLSIVGGSFGGYTDNLSSNNWTEGIGGELTRVSNAILDSTTFTGKSIDNSDNAPGGGPPIPGQTFAQDASGSAGLGIASTSTVSIVDSGIIGGNAGIANVNQSNTWAVGGNGIEIYSSYVVLSNSTVSGGAGGEAQASSGFEAMAYGGHGVYASNSTVVIHSGTYNGGTAGSENGRDSLGGAALFITDGSSATNFGGTFTGANAPAVYIQDSSLTTYGGTYTGGGLYSITTGSETNTLDLLGGTFGSLTFINESNGIQYVTASNIAVSADVYQDGGTVEITNLENSAFQTVEINSGTMAFMNDFALTGNLTLISSNSTASFTALNVRDGAIVNTGVGSITSSGNITFETGSTVTFLVLTNQSGNIQATGVNFETNSTLLIDASFAGFSSGVATTEVINASLSGFDTNMNAEIIVSVNTNVDSRTTADFSQTGSGLSVIFDTERLEDYWGLTNGGQFANLANELEDLDLATPEMNVLINNLGSQKSSELVAKTYFTTLNTFQVTKQGLDAAVALALSRGTEFRDQLLLPGTKGTAGPSLEPQNDWRFWLKYYGNFYSRDEEGLNAEYDAIMHGGVLGMDRSFGNLLIGLAGGAGNYTIDTENNAEQNMNAFQGALYSTYGAGHSYLDLGLAYGFNSVDTRTADPFVLEGEFDTQLFSAYLGGGIGFEIPSMQSVITPEASVRYTLYEQDAYTETGTAAAPRSIDAFDSDSIVGSIGLNYSMLNSAAFETFAFKLEGRAHWMREFNPEPGELNYQLVGGANDYTIIYPFLDEDTIRLGFGFTFFNTKERSLKNVMLRLDFDELIGKDFNSHNLSAKAIYAF